MIGRLNGIILEKNPPELLIEVQGVCYEVSSPMSTFYSLNAPNQKVILHTHLIVREDSHQLYGFINKTERRLFRTLLKVSGIGPKVALAILSSISPDEFVRSVMDNDSHALVKLPGIGKKTAERLIIEMRDRLKDWFDGISMSEIPMRADFTTSNTSAFNEAITALVALGYKQQEAQKSVQAIATADMASEEIIRQALRTIADKK